LQKNDSTIAFEIDRLSFKKQLYRLPYILIDNKNFRVMQIIDMPPMPCGGTHLSSIREIGLMRINKIKNKNGILRISYEVT
jgi:alanyl-tRNA synthetase